MAATVWSWSSHRATLQEAAVIHAEASWDASWPELPGTVRQAARPLNDVRTAYAFAARHPDLLQYIPCYCGCEREGHRSNAQCYLRRPEAHGRPDWDEHAVNCGICVDIAREVMKRHAAGESVATIRHAVQAEYEAEYGPGTPTPLPSR